MNYKFHLFSFGLAFTIIIGCKQEASRMSAEEMANYDGFVIQGEILNGAETKLFLEEAKGQNYEVFDTARIDKDGLFEIKGKVQEKGLYRLRMSNGATVLLALDDDKINLSTDMNDATNYTLSGSTESATLKQLLDRTNDLSKKNNALVAQSRTVPRDANYNAALRQIQGQINNNTAIYRQFLTKYVDTVSSNMIASFAALTLDPKQDYQLIKKVADKVQAEQPSTFMERNLVAMMRNIKAPLMVGSEAPDISMANPNGKEIALADMTGEVILLDFWASWCRPCRVENPNVVRLYNKYKSKGFNIYSVSLDKQKNKWEKAIVDDKLNWSAHVSDLKGWQTPAAKAYGVSGIPKTFLLDKDQNIIAMNLRGKALENKLAELLD